MTQEVDSSASRDEQTAAKPAYRRPVLTELDVGDTAVGVVAGSPENVSYIS